MQKKIRKLDLFGKRDFTLALLQIGLGAESGPLPYLDNAALNKPYFVAERKNGVVDLFIDTAQVDWQKEEIFKRIEKDIAFIPSLMEQSKISYSKIESILEEGLALSLDTFQSFVDDTFVAWRWWAGWWWAIEALEQKNTFPEILDAIMLFRKKTERFAPATDHVVRTTAQRQYPDLSVYAEVVSLKEILSDAIPANDVLKARYEHYLLVDDEIYTGNRIQEAIAEAGIELVIPKPAEYKLSDNNTLIGQVAFRGMYTGKVSIVLTKEDANAFKEGDVLVASQTTPDFIYAIKRAGAIVADEGGIISHASISSREFEIPCIIGTKIATQVLKDGDLVEVDADNGIVRILNENNG
jgi:phosphoenolpyruvate synthase/pyruvate phosphate dikinase